MKFKKILALVLAVILTITAFTGCSWFKKKSESIISVDSVKAAVSGIGASETNDHAAVADNTEVKGSYFIATKDSTVEDILTGKWQSGIKGMDELIDYCYNAHGCRFNLLAIRFDSEEEAKTFFDQRISGVSVHKDASGIDTTSNTVNMTLIGDDSFDPDNPANIVSDGFYIDKEYVMFYSLSLESANPEVSGFAGSVFEKIGLENPVDGPMDIIV